MSYTIKVPPPTVQTHHGQCWRNASHWQCAVGRVEELTELVEEMLAVFCDACDCGECGPCKLAARAERVITELTDGINCNEGPEAL
jgi:hypothetical protein